MVLGERTIPLRPFWERNKDLIHVMSLGLDETDLVDLARRYCDRVLLRHHIRSRYAVFSKRWPHIEVALRRAAMADALPGRLGSVRRSMIASLDLRIEPSLVSRVRILGQTGE